MTSAEIRQRFLDAFASRGHVVVRSSPLVPANDPTLFFTNAGMVQFKQVFTGAEPRPCARATSVQKCLRVSGKHNDLENVGRTPRHHTFFEMLGNFSFGDYFKPEAIRWAWEILTLDFGLPAERLWVTVYEHDDEAFQVWTREIGLPPERVQRMGASENFWSMGPTGPCGPCSEIHWDRGPSISARTGGPATGDDRYMELWNLVFMQHEQHADGSRTPLPRPSIDTGMGLERLAAVLQGVQSNYETDIFQAVVRRAAELAGRRSGSDPATDVALHVIADHSRAAAFLIADGVMPSNEERGYVLRRILRRAIRFGVELGLEAPFLWKCADAVIDVMGPAWPELVERRDFVHEVVRAEEQRFGETLHRGLRLLDRSIERLGEGERLPGELVFRLYDTYGFPPDLTRLVAGERGVPVDDQGYEQAMAAQRAAGRAGWRGSGEASVQVVDAALTGAIPPTRFTGYDSLEADSQVLALLDPDGRALRALEPGDQGSLVTAVTPFYAESGGQVADRGVVSGPGGARFQVLDVQKGRRGVLIHHGSMRSGSLATGDAVHLAVDPAHRAPTRLNHTATHLLQAALRQVLGRHVSQKGSLVEPAHLRFDFSHHRPVSADELHRVEDIVCRQILANQPVLTRVMDLDDALASGATALFGEKYAERVRVVSVAGFSTELCGGTHASRTGDIGSLRITAETGVAAGVRRIEAVTGAAALLWSRRRERAATLAASHLRSPVELLPQTVERLLSKRRETERQLEQLRQELARAAAAGAESKAVDVGGTKVLALELPGDAATLRSQADRLRDRLGSGVVVLGSRDQGKVLLVAAVTRDIAGRRFHAGRIVKQVARLVGGGGGGGPDLAQAGGRRPEALRSALDQVPRILRGMLDGGQGA